MKNNRSFISVLFLLSLVLNALPLPALSQTAGLHAGDHLPAPQQESSPEYAAVLEKLFGTGARAAAKAFETGSAELLSEVSSAAGRRAEEALDKQISDRKEASRIRPAADVPAKRLPARKPAKKPAIRKKFGFHVQPKIDWRQLAFGFQPVPQQDGTPDIKMTETDKEIKAQGSDKKTFETAEAKGTRTQNVETKYTKDGKTFGVEIKDTQVIDAVSKPDGKSFRREMSIVWGADVDACPDANGVSAGTGKAKVVSKTTYTENGSSVTMTSEFDLRAKLVGSVNDEAVLTHYDMQVDAYTANSGYEDALARGLIKEIKIRDGRYGVQYNIPGNTIEISDGKYGGKRTPAKIGKATAKALTQMSDADAATVTGALDKMVPAIWNSANEMYKSAEKNWKNNGCVEIAAKAARSTLEQGEEVEVTAETIHIQDRAKVNAQFSAEGFGGSVSPETQSGTPAATFTYIQEGEDSSMLSLRSVSKRGIGETDVEFQLKKEEEPATETGTWTGTITAKRQHREEREKRSGANLAENGGNITVTTDVSLRLTGRLDRTVDATNAYIANISGSQKSVDFEYDKYKVDEGYCGPNAVPYKGPKEITRTSTTTANYGTDTRVYLEAGSTGGTASFSLPEINGTTLHKYVHRSPCAEHDRANTNEASNEDAPTPGGSFSFSFPIAPGQKTVKGTITVREDDGRTTTYTWELTRK